MITKLKFLRNFFNRNFSPIFGSNIGETEYTRTQFFNGDNSDILNSYYLNNDAKEATYYSIDTNLNQTLIEKQLLFPASENKPYIFRDEPNIQLLKKNYQYVFDFVTWVDLYDNTLPIFDVADFDFIFYNSELADYEISLSDVLYFVTDGTTVVFTGEPLSAGVLNLTVTLTNINEPSLTLDIVIKITLEEEII